MENPTGGGIQKMDQQPANARKTRRDFFKGGSQGHQPREIVGKENRKGGAHGKTRVGGGNKNSQSAMGEKVHRARGGPTVGGFSKRVYQGENSRGVKNVNYQHQHPQPHEDSPEKNSGEGAQPFVMRD